MEFDDVVSIQQHYAKNKRGAVKTWEYKPLTVGDALFQVVSIQLRDQTFEYFYSSDGGRFTDQKPPGLPFDSVLKRPWKMNPRVEP